MYTNRGIASQVLFAMVVLLFASTAGGLVSFFSILLFDEQITDIRVPFLLGFIVTSGLMVGMRRWGRPKPRKRQPKVDS